MVTVSSHTNRLLICVAELATGRLITQSYLNTSDKATLTVNPFSQRFEFILWTTNTLMYYRVTSIQTLEYQELNLKEVAHQTNGLASARFVRLANQELILLGTVDGSLIVADSRSATVLVLCKSIIRSPVIQIRYS
jgi:hypothetical protein